MLNQNTAHGIAIAAAEGRANPTFSACVAEVTVTSGGIVNVDKLTSLPDVGVAINLKNIRAQIEGSILWD